MAGGGRGGAANKVRPAKVAVGARVGREFEAKVGRGCQADLFTCLAAREFSF